MPCSTVRLCGISNCFQLVSPCIRQVIHALLTRPPLTQISLGFNLSPFDLHVLGTPPAFILSQDQTLMFYDCFLLPVSLWLLSSIFSYSGLLFLGCPLLDFSCPLKFSRLPRCRFRLVLEFSGLHYCLFVKVQLLLSASFKRLSALCCPQWQL